jgi:hypothetical protein
MCFMANGNILPSTFVKIDTTANNAVLQAGSNVRTIGIAQEGTKYPPSSDQSNVYAAEQYDNIEVYADGTDECLLKLGAGGAYPGALLISDASGYGIIAATSGPTAQEVGAVALQAGIASSLIRVKVFLQAKVYPALS